MAKKKKNESFKTTASNNNKNNNNNEDEGLAILVTLPLALAIHKQDTAQLSQLLENVLPMSIDKITDLVLERSVGEAFTGGRSTPVVYISCHVHRKPPAPAKNAVVQPMTTRTTTTTTIPRHFVAKLLVFPNVSEDPKTRMRRDSYHMEHAFYTKLVPTHLYAGDNSGVASSKAALLLPIPKLIAAEVSPQAVCFLMTDLRSHGFPLHPHFLTVSDNDENDNNEAAGRLLQRPAGAGPYSCGIIHRALVWLASFHARFWKDHAARNVVWERGGYWTKPEQQGSLTMLATQWSLTLKWLDKQNMSYSATTKSVGRILQELAQPLSQFLTIASTTIQSDYTTLIHGDFKAANMFFSSIEATADGNPGPESVAVLDFQFTGGGLGAEDVAYLLFPDAYGDYSDVQEHLLQWYHKNLVEQLVRFQRGGPSSLRYDTFRKHYALAQLNFLQYWMAKGWVASTPGDASLVQAVDKTLQQMGGDRLLGGHEICTEMLSKWLEQ